MICNRPRLFVLILCCSVVLTPAAHAEKPNSSLNLGPVHMLKLVFPQPLASTRAEYDYVHPLHQGYGDRLFIDAKPFAELRPLSDSGDGAPVIQATGQSTRVGYRRLFGGGSALWGVSGGYDSLWQQGSYYQQLGAGFEIKRRNLEVVATASLPLRLQNGFANEPVPLSALTLQVSLPTGVKGLAFEPRIYTVGSPETGTVLGTQMQFTYATSQSSSATISCNYDALGGVSGSLTLQIVFPSLLKQARHQAIDPSLVGNFTGPVGNNGSRVIRLNNSAPALGN